MSFKNRREWLFVYSVKDANPNGDPLNANHPRFDQESNQILVSDVRIKRTIRDQWLREGKPVFIDALPKKPETRVQELKKQFSTPDSKESMRKCLDARLFGVTSPIEKEAFSWTGPVQFKWGRSLHQAKAELIQGTGAFTTKDEAEQRTFRNEYLVPFVVLGVYGIANQNASEITGATDDDLELLVDALWAGTQNLITRSKVGHQPRLFLEIRYQENYQGLIGSLDEKVELEQNNLPLDVEAQLTLRNLKNVNLSLQPLVASLAKHKESIQSVHLRYEDDLNLSYLEEMKKLLPDKLTVQVG